MTMIRKIELVNLIAVSMIVGHGCSNDDSVTSANGPYAGMQASYVNSVYSDNVGEFIVSVYYEAGAEPYTGPLGLTGNDTWSITRNSLQALFMNHVGRVVTVPSGLAAMNSLPDQGKTVWTQAQLLALARTHAPVSTPTEVAVGVYFVNGSLEGNPDTLGVQFLGYPYAFIFKDAVMAGGGDLIAQRYIEQAIVVHEIAHAIGLVNNGLPLTAPHEDPSHRKHSANKDCVMYWKFESRIEALTAVAAFIAGNRLNLFAGDSLSDARSYHP